MDNPLSDEVVRAPILALDLGVKRVGAAVCDELSISIRRLDPIARGSWKQLLSDVRHLLQRFDAKTLVIGFPLRLDGSTGDTATEIRRTAENFAKSLPVPVYLQDERLSSAEAEENLLAAGHKHSELIHLVDGEAAAIILRDFLPASQTRILVPRS